MKRLLSLVLMLGLSGGLYWELVGKHEYHFATLLRGEESQSGYADPPSFLDMLSDVSGGLKQASAVQNGAVPRELSSSALLSFVGSHVVAEGEHQVIERSPGLARPGFDVTQIVSVDDIRRSPDERIDPAYYKSFVTWRASPLMMRNCRALLGEIATKCRIDTLDVRETASPEMFSVTARLSIMPRADLGMPLGEMHDRRREIYAANLRSAPSWTSDSPTIELTAGQVLERVGTICAVLTRHLNRCTLYVVRIEEEVEDTGTDVAPFATFTLAYAIPLDPDAPDPNTETEARDAYRQIEARINSDIVAGLMTP